MPRDREPPSDPWNATVLELRKIRGREVMGHLPKMLPGARTIGTGWRVDTGIRDAHLPSELGTLLD